MATSQEIAQALRYGPQTAGYLRRSAYLEDALRAMQQDGSQNIRSPWELAAKLAGVALLNRASSKAQDRTLAAIAADKQEKLSRLLANLPEPAAAPTFQLPTPPAPPPAPQPQPQPAAPPPPPPTPAVSFTPEDRDALTRMLVTEAIGEGPQGMAAAGHVALNRLKKGYGGAKSLRDVVYAPSQFEGMHRAAQIKPEEYQAASQVADAILGGQLPDPTNGAINFLNPDLQTQLGRQIPAWAQGQGQRIGRHVFFGGNPQADVQMTSAPAPQGPMQIQGQFPAEPYQVAAIGQTPPPPSEPGRSPPDVGAPPAATPQAAAGGNPQVTTYQPTAQEVLLVRRLISSSDPDEQAKGEALYWKLMEKMTQPVEWETTTVNGLPVQVNKTTGELRMLGVPDAAKTRTVAAPNGLPPGTVAQEKPTGDLSVVYQPPQGYQGAPSQLQATPGGPADPKAGMNLVNNEGKLRDDYAKEIQPYIQAREGYQKVVQAAGTATPAGDIALVFGFMKTLDPGSTVREGEQATVQNSGTIDQSIQNVYNSLLSGKGRLTPEQRASFSEAARRQFGVYENTYKAATQRYGELATSYGFNPNRIVRSFDPIEPYRPPGPTPIPDAAMAAHAELTRQGKIDQKQPYGSKAHPFIARDDATLDAMERKTDAQGRRVNIGKFFIGPNGRLGVIE